MRKHFLLLLKLEYLHSNLQYIHTIISKVPSAFYKTKVWLPIKSDDTKKIIWLKNFSLQLEQQDNVFALKTTFDFYHASEIHDFQMNAKWDLKKKPTQIIFLNCKRMEKIEQEGFLLLCMFTNLIICPLKKTSCLEHLNSKKGSFKAKHFHLTKNSRAPSKKKFTYFWGRVIRCK